MQDQRRTQGINLILIFRVQKPLKENLPQLLRDRDFTQNLDDASKRWLSTLFKSLSNIPANTNGQTSLPQEKKNPFISMNNNSYNFQNQVLNNNNPFVGYESSIYFNGDTKFLNNSKQVYYKVIDYYVNIYNYELNTQTSNLKLLFFD